MYTDRVAKVHHLLLSEFDPWRNSSILYLKVNNSDGKILAQTSFLADNLRSLCHRDTIIGDDKGHVYLFICTPLFNITRTFTISFSESLDGGNSWSKLVPLHDMEEECGRFPTGARVIKETGRLYLFYSHYNFTSDKHSIRFMTRSPGSAKFSVERTVQNCVQASTINHIVKLEYSHIGKGRIALHVFWTEQSQTSASMYYIKSEDGGSSWTGPAAITGNKAIGSIPFDLAYDEQVTPTILGVYMDGTLNAFYTNDSGRTFGSISGRSVLEKMLPSSYPQKSVAVCGTRDHPMAYRLEMVNDHELTYTAYDLVTMRSSVLKKPTIDGISWYTGVRMKCEGNVVTAVISGLGNKYEKLNVTMFKDTIQAE